MFGWSKYAWIFSYLINWVKKFSSIIRLFSTTFNATMNPVFLSTAKNTLANLPSPSFSIISKESILKEDCLKIKLELTSFDFNWLFYSNFLFCLEVPFKKVGIDFSDLAPLIMLSVELVEDVYFNCLMVFCS